MYHHYNMYYIPHRRNTQMEKSPKNPSEAPKGWPHRRALVSVQAVFACRAILHEETGELSVFGGGGGGLQ